MFYYYNLTFRNFLLSKQISVWYLIYSLHICKEETSTELTDLRLASLGLLLFTVCMKIGDAYGVTWVKFRGTFVK